MTSDLVQLKEHMRVPCLDIRVGHGVQQQLSDARTFISKETSGHMQGIQSIQLLTCACLGRREQRLMENGVNLMTREIMCTLV